MYLIARKFLVATALLLTLAETASACSCITRTTLRQHYAAAEHVLVGRVLATNEVKSRLNAPGWGGVVAKIELIEVIKSHPRRPTQVVTGQGSGDCGVPMIVGTSYVFFIDPNGEVDICSGTRPYVKGNENLEGYLRDVKRVAMPKRAP